MPYIHMSTCISTFIYASFSSAIIFIHSCNEIVYENGIIGVENP